MKKLGIYIIMGLLFVSACKVDDYEDANPKPLKDGPALFEGDLSGDVIRAANLNGVVLDYVQVGKTFGIEVEVVDAPGKIDAVDFDLTSGHGTVAADATSFNAVKGLDKGTFTVNFTATTSSAGTTAVESIAINVSDAQTPSKEATLTHGGVKVVGNCLASLNLVGWYDTVASGFNSETGENYTGLTAKVELYIRANNGADNPGNYRMRNASFGLYTAQGYAEPFANIAVCGNVISNGTPAPGDGLQYTGTLNDNGTITITWSNVYGDTGTVTLTPGTAP